MQARMRNPALILPDALPLLQQISKLVSKTDIPAKTLGLVHMRTSQINHCAVCLDLHVRTTWFPEETLERVLAVAAWRDAPFFTDAERAALALTEAVTRLGEDGVPDDVWAEAQKHYNETALAGLILSIAMVNVWNRLNVTTRQVAGATR